MGGNGRRGEIYITEVVNNANVGTEEEVNHRIQKGRKSLGKLRKAWKEEMISREEQRALYERFNIPPVV